MTEENQQEKLIQQEQTIQQQQAQIQHLENLSRGQGELLKLYRTNDTQRQQIQQLSSLLTKANNKIKELEATESTD